MQQRRRAGARVLLRAAVVGSGLVAAYYLLPMEREFTASAVAILLAGLVGVVLLLAWQTRGIVRSPYPRLRAVEALALIVPAFLLLFAATYYLLERSVPGSFNEPLTRTDALYFTVTVFSTTGFGDIVAQSQTARVVATVQMVSDLLLIGVAARVLLAAVQVGVRRKQENGRGGADDGTRREPPDGA